MHNLAPITPNLAIMPTDKIMHTENAIAYFLSQQTEGTARTYFSTLQSFFKWCPIDYREINPFNALDYDAYLKSTYSPATVQRQIATLKTFFAFVMESGLITKNPFAIIKQHGVTNRQGEKFLLLSEVERLLKALREEGEREYILGLLLVSTGMRISEIQQLSWCDFILMPDDSISINALRKGGERQLLSLKNDVWEAVKGYMKREPNQLDRSHLFSNPSGNRASDVSLRAWIVAASKKAGIKKKVTPHTLRHTFCTQVLNSGADLRDTQVYMNHKSIQTTQIYMHGKNQKVGDFLNIKVN